MASWFAANQSGLRSVQSARTEATIDWLFRSGKVCAVTASQIIEEIKRLDPKEQLGVIRFAYQLDAERRLTGSELSSLAQKMVNTTDAAEALRIRESIVRGFYGQRDA